MEIVYNCDKTKNGIIRVNLELTPEHCSPFKLSWLKICKDKGNNKN